MLKKRNRCAILSRLICCELNSVAHFFSPDIGSSSKLNARNTWWVSLWMVLPKEPHLSLHCLLVAKTKLLTNVEKKRTTWKLFCIEGHVYAVQHKPQLREGVDKRRCTGSARRLKLAVRHSSTYESNSAEHHALFSVFLSLIPRQLGKQHQQLCMRIFVLNSGWIDLCRKSSAKACSKHSESSQKYAQRQVRRMTLTFKSNGITA